MILDYKTMGKNIYIHYEDNYFLVSDYNNNLLTEISIFENNNSIEFNLHNEDVPFFDEIINLFSELLYFKGNKQKKVVYSGKKNVKKFGFVNNVKSINSFENERSQKFDTIDELYNYPHLVPWNLVPREWDVIELVDKYAHNNQKILEIGSGYGKNLDLLINHGYTDVHGLEYSKNAYELSKKIVNNNMLDDITNSKLTDDMYDLIIDIGCIHCVDNNKRADALKKVKNLLKSDGLIISRYFLTKNSNWIKKYPIKIDKFGSTKREIINLFSNYFVMIDSFIDNECVYYIGRKK